MDNKPIGKLVSSIRQPDGGVWQTYEVEILGTKCRYFNYLPPNIPPLEPFTNTNLCQN